MWHLLTQLSPAAPAWRERRRPCPTALFPDGFTLTNPRLAQVKAKIGG